MLKLLLVLGMLQNLCYIFDNPFILLSTALKKVWTKEGNQGGIHFNYIPLLIRTQFKQQTPISFTIKPVIKFSSKWNREIHITKAQYPMSIPFLHYSGVNNAGITIRVASSIKTYTLHPDSTPTYIYYSLQSCRTSQRPLKGRSSSGPLICGYRAVSLEFPDAVSNSINIQNS